MYWVACCLLHTYWYWYRLLVLLLVLLVQTIWCELFAGERCSWPSVCQRRMVLVFRENFHTVWYKLCDW